MEKRGARRKMRGARCEVSGFGTGPDIVRIDRLTCGGAWPFFVGSVICLVILLTNEI